MCVAGAGLRAVLAAIDALGEHPYPDDAFPFGSTGLHRLRVGTVPGALHRYRRPHLRRPHRPGTRRPLTFRDPVPRLSWNQTWCELWFTRVVSSS